MNNTEINEMRKDSIHIRILSFFFEFFYQLIGELGFYCVSIFFSFDTITQRVVAILSTIAIFCIICWLGDTLIKSYEVIDVIRPTSDGYDS